MCQKTYYRDMCHRKSYTAISIPTFSETLQSYAMKTKALCFNMNNEHKMKY